MPLSWKRPVSSEYPKIWHKFSVLGENYLVQDLPQSMAEEAIKFLNENYFGDEPLSAAYNLHNDAFFVDRVGELYRTMVIKQKTVLVCFKEGSDEIVGLNMNYVLCGKDFTFFAWIRAILEDAYLMFQRLYRLLTDRKYKLRSLINKNPNIERYQAVIESIKEGVTFKVDEVLTSSGLCVAPKYRGRGIGVELLKTRKQFCQEFNIKLTVNVFTSRVGNACAKKAGFKLERKLSFDKIRRDYPHLKLPMHIKSSYITYRSMQIDRDAYMCERNWKSATIRSFCLSLFSI